MKPLLGLAFFCALAVPAGAQNASWNAPLGISLESVIYPAPVHFLPLKNGGQDVRMAYMDAPSQVFALRTVKPKTPVLLLHGKNFGGYYWGNVVRRLNREGFRVIVPDQIGFGKSSKPDIPYSFGMLADNTVKLLDTLKIPKVMVVGHSMGGMLATYLAAHYPTRVERLVLENPIGLEDYGKATGKVPLEKLYANELKDTNPAKIRAFYKNYFHTWKEKFGYLTQIRIRVTKSGEYPRWAKSSAQTYKMILEQPVVDEFAKVRAPSLLIIGQSDRTVVGKNYMRPEVARQFGNYPALGVRTMRRMKNAIEVEIPNTGHIPHLESPATYEDALKRFLLADLKQ